MFDQAVITALQGADVDDHVDFAGSVHNCAPGFIRFHVRQGCAEGKPNHGANRNARALQMTGAGAHPGGVHAYRSEMILRRFFAEVLDLSL